MRSKVSARSSVREVPSLIPRCDLYSLFRLLSFPCRELNQGRRRRNENGKKTNRFRLAKQQLCTYITLFCTFRNRRCMTTIWKCLISRFFEDGNTKQQFPFSFPELFNTVLSNSTPKKFANIWRIKWDGINAIKFEAVQIHFLSDVFIAVVA